MKFIVKSGKSDLAEIRGLFYFISRINAILIVLIALSFLISQYGFASDSELIINTTTHNTSKIVLPDGSKVMLNKNSELSYPTDFNEVAREVNLKGEAYFELARNEDLTFIINTSTGAKVQELLPAAFNINTNNNGNVVVDVQRGAVVLLSPYNLLGHAILDKGEKGVLSDNKLYESKSNQQNYLSWKTGILTYIKSPLEEVIRDLSNHYDTTIIVNDSLLKLSKITIFFNKLTLDEVLAKLKSSLNVNYVRTDNGLLILKD